MPLSCDLNEQRETSTIIGVLLAPGTPKPVVLLNPGHHLPEQLIADKLQIAVIQVAIEPCNFEQHVLHGAKC